MNRQCVAIPFLVALWAISSSRRPKSTKDRLPEPSEIASIEASVVIPLEPESKGRAEFAVPKAYWESLLKSFRPYEHDPKSTKWPVYGGLEIKLLNGTVKDVMLGPGKFKVNKIYFSGGEMNKQVEVLKAAYKESRTSATKARNQ
jgi:hypothetical protein